MNGAGRMKEKVMRRNRRRANGKKDGDAEMEERG
jgi:hypothetical protein